MQKRPETFETIILVLFGVRTFPSTTLDFVLILSTNADVGPAKNPDMLDNMAEVDLKGTVVRRRPKLSKLLLCTDRL